jgi:predicted PurR-regulated permease PerM
MEAEREVSSARAVPPIDLAIRLTLIAGLLSWSVILVRPFLHPIIWGAVLAVAVGPWFERISATLGNRRKTTAALFFVVPLLLLLVPATLIVDSIVTEVQALSENGEAGKFTVPAPPKELAAAPLVGKKLYEIWDAAHGDLAGTLQKFSPQLLEFRETLGGLARGIVAALITFFFALIAMAVFLVTAVEASQTVRGLSRRVAGDRGERLVSLARDTTRSVAKGIVGVALIQAAMGGVACALAGVPGAGILTIAMVIVAVAQLPTILILGPVAGYLFMNDSLVVAVTFSVWTLVVGVIDNVLKPLLLGKGVAVPMIVVFLGAIGGLLTSGVLGLFVGPVVLVIAFTLINSWAVLSPPPLAPETEAQEPTATQRATTSPG